MSSGSQVGRFLAAPPGVPADRIATLRAGFDAMMKDDEFLKAAATQRLKINATSGPDVQAIIVKGGVVSAGDDQARAGRDRREGVRRYFRGSTTGLSCPAYCSKRRA